MSYRLTNRVSEWIDQAVEKLALGDQITWECSLVMTEQGPHLAFVFFMPGIVLGSTLHGALMVGNPDRITEDSAEEVVEAVLRDLRTERSKQATGVTPSINGQRN